MKKWMLFVALTVAILASGCNSELGKAAARSIALQTYGPGAATATLGGPVCGWVLVEVIGKNPARPQVYLFLDPTQGTVVRSLNFLSILGAIVSAPDHFPLRGGDLGAPKLEEGQTRVKFLFRKAGRMMPAWFDLQVDCAMTDRVTVAITVPDLDLKAEIVMKLSPAE